MSPLHTGHESVRGQVDEAKDESKQPDPKEFRDHYSLLNPPCLYDTVLKPKKLLLP